jgi:hypothetical protein
VTHTPSDSPLLVTGLPRCGTSWVGKMLEASGEVVYINEPLNVQHPPGQSPGVLNVPVTHRFQYICRDNEKPWQQGFAKTLSLKYDVWAELRSNRGAYDLARMAKYVTSFTAGRLRNRRPLLDDPFAVLSTAWFVERLGCKAVVLVRDPVAFVGSWKSLGWTIYFHELLEQPLLVRDLLGSYDDELRALVGSQDRIAKAAALWRVTYSIVDQMRRQSADVQVWRYEDLVRRPLESFREIYDTFGLTWTPHVQGRIRSASSNGRGSRASHVWSFRGGISRTAFRPIDPASALASYRERLTPQEIGRIRTLTADIANIYYDNQSAEPEELGA